MLWANLQILLYNSNIYSNLRELYNVKLESFLQLPLSFLSSFLDQKIHCTYGLVDSRCGSQAGDFAFHVARQSELDQILRGHCRITQNPDYPSEFPHQSNVAAVRKALCIDPDLLGFKICLISVGPLLSLQSHGLF